MLVQQGQYFHMAGLESGGDQPLIMAVFSSDGESDDVAVPCRARREITDRGRVL